MGTIISGDTRRISFENTFAVPPGMALQRASDVDAGSIHENLFDDNEEQIMYRDNKPVDEGDVDYWAYRIDKLKREHNVINNIMETEYDNMIEKTSKQYRIPEISREQKIQQLKPCFDLQAKVLECYQENPNEPLNCSAEIKAFSECVSSFKYQETF